MWSSSAFLCEPFTILIYFTKNRTRTIEKNEGKTRWKVVNCYSLYVVLGVVIFFCSFSPFTEPVHMKGCENFGFSWHNNICEGSISIRMRIFLYVTAKNKIITASIMIKMSMFSWLTKFSNYHVWRDLCIQWPQACVCVSQTHYGFPEKAPTKMTHAHFAWALQTHLSISHWVFCL